ncbi:MAG: copper chaperone [Myxococcota bacterium]|jgi:copper chaperone
MTESVVTYRVSGMTCGGCERSVNRALSAALPGVQVSASHAEATVAVTGAHDAAAVARVVEDAGFEFGGAAG